ncbi:hypothetical protein Q5424_09290 [Conexibacter sp. JD483]|uniref:hypothetical protein n=1 Tax=unclassified Conexibacter TaxID=2627773 RepID=UPI00271E0850|nr:MULTISPECIES: hypothetical protein [unclassified Conexibacter]MDO8187230.1 hypothetical protein [Conexibacter sp. CPCC 205706]MDO8199327.1 hypothetical protein [Conexibacter sp. CPCC 205762]MDR9369272.1 hypothetical protein [Conexibacter sp. JD483]
MQIRQRTSLRAALHGALRLLAGDDGLDALREAHYASVREWAVRPLVDPDEIAFDAWPHPDAADEAPVVFPRRRAA